MRVFLVKVVNRSYINVMGVCKKLMLIYCVDRALYSSNYGIPLNSILLDSHNIIAGGLEWILQRNEAR